MNAVRMTTRCRLEPFDWEAESRLGDRARAEVELVDGVRAEGAQVAPVPLHAPAIERGRRACGSEEKVTGLPGQAVGGLDHPIQAPVILRRHHAAGLER